MRQSEALEEHYKRDCLARWICDLPTHARRREVLANLTMRHGRAFGDDMRRRVAEVWAERKGNAGNHGTAAEEMSA